MKIDLLDVIQDALIGGTNGDMAFKYNNHFIRMLFDKYSFDNEDIIYKEDFEKAKFIAFLKEVIEEADEIEK